MFWNFWVWIHRYSALTYDVIKSYVTRVWDKNIRNGYITLEQGLLCDKELSFEMHKQCNSNECFNAQYNNGVDSGIDVNTVLSLLDQIERCTGKTIC